jgi:signal transduction histidine kinase
MGATPRDRPATSGEGERPPPAGLTPAAAAHDLVETLRSRLQMTSRIGDLLGHELRNVAVVLQVHATLLVDWDQLDPERRRSSVETLQTQSTKLCLLLSGLMALGRSTGVTQDVVDVDEVIRQASSVAVTANVADEDDVSVVLSPPNLRVRINWFLLYVVARNLVDNALRHGAPPVEITVEHLRDRLWVRVDDAGPGVDEKVAPHLFERGLHRPHPTRGSGLGMSIVRDLVRLEGGTIAHLRREPTGASFVVELPVD